MGLLDPLRTEIQNAAESAMNEAESKGYLATLRNLSDFYSKGKPKMYKRTGKLGNTPETTGVLGSGNHYEANIYLNTQYTYEPDETLVYSKATYSRATQSASWVATQAEVGGAGILGKPGFWAASEKDIENAFYDALKKRFN